MPRTTGDQIGLTERTVVVLEAVVDAGEPVGPRGLSRTTGIDRSAVSRILRQLEELEILARRDDGYVPGPRLFAMGRVLQANDSLGDAVNEILGRLVDRFDETCYVCTFHGETAVFTHQVQSTKPLRLVAELGKPVPLHAGAAGRAILSALPDDEIRRLLAETGLDRVTPGTVTNLDRILILAAEDRERGFSISREERIHGGAAIAAPFFAAGGRCQGSIVFTCPMSRLDPERIEEIGSALAEAAADVSIRIGHRPGRKEPSRV